jgi:hypothetical protein
MCDTVNNRPRGYNMNNWTDGFTGMLEYLGLSYFYRIILFEDLG